MNTEFLGKQLSGPFTIPSGIVTTTPAIIQRVIDTMPEIGVITTKSIGMQPRTGNREPVYSQFAPGCFVNAVGLTNPGMDEALEPTMAQEEDCWENDSDLPANLELALVNLEEASALAPLMGEEILRVFTSIKQDELEDYHMRLSSWEIHYLGSML